MLCFVAARGQSDVKEPPYLGRAMVMSRLLTHCHCPLGVLLLGGNAAGLRCCKWCFRAVRQEEQTLQPAVKFSTTCERSARKKARVSEW